MELRKGHKSPPKPDFGGLLKHPGNLDIFVQARWWRETIRRFSLLRQSLPAHDSNFVSSSHETDRKISRHISWRFYKSRCTTRNSSGNAF